MLARKPILEEGDVVGLVGRGPVGTVRKINRNYVVTEKGVYHRIALVLLMRKCNCGKKH